MEYVEILRARRILTWYTAVIIVGLIIEAISYYAGHGHNRNDGTLDVSSLVGIACVAGLIVATIVAPSLSTEAARTIPLIWTRPLPRAAIAGRYIAVDVVTILLAFAIMIVAMIVGIAIVGGLPIVQFDPASTGREFLLGFGGVVMWYAVISAAAARLPGFGGLLAGLSWAVFPILAGLVYAHYVPIWLHDVILVLNYVNPMAWMGDMTHESVIIPVGLWMRTLGVWAMAIVLLALSVRLWSTREA